MAKKGETRPSIRKGQALLLHGKSCSKPYIVSKPTARIEKTSILHKRFYNENCWKCLNCNWESERMRTRTT